MRLSCGEPERERGKAGMVPVDGLATRGMGWRVAVIRLTGHREDTEAFDILLNILNYTQNLGRFPMLSQGHFASMMEVYIISL